MALGLPADAATSYEAELVLGLCAYLVQSGIGHYDVAGYPDAYKGPLPAITIGGFPASPRPLIGVTYYADVRSPEHPVVKSMIQIKTRAGGRDPIAAINLDAAIKRRLHEQRYLQLGRVRVSRIRRESFAPLGPSPTDGAHESTSAYSFQGLQWLLPAAAAGS